MSDPANLPDSPSSTAEPEAQLQFAVVDEPSCRICLEGGSGDSEKGRLFVPCRCRGTARFVHEHCLSEWRRLAVDRKNLWRCNTCQFHYIPASERRLKPYILPFLVVLVVVCFFSWRADGSLKKQDKRADRRVLQLHVNEWVLEQHGFEAMYPAPWFLSFLDIRENFLREAVSAIGVLLGDCRWYNFRSAMVSYECPVETRHALCNGDICVEQIEVLSACGRLWGLPNDFELPSLAVRLVMWIVSGALEATTLVCAVAAYVCWICSSGVTRRLPDKVALPLLSCCFGVAFLWVDRGLFMYTLSWRRHDTPSTSFWSAGAIILLALFHVLYASVLVSSFLRLLPPCIRRPFQLSKQHHERRVMDIREIKPRRIRPLSVKGSGAGLWRA
ncbi:hypothetical protein JCM10213_000088 [Rhodosporidiobolus nylandii]